MGDFKGVIPPLRFYKEVVVKDERLTIIIPDNIEEIKRKIEILKEIINSDSSEKDRSIHTETLSVLETELKRREGVIKN